MSKQGDGGPAFPSPESEHYHPEAGMSLRDWFAGMSLTGMFWESEGKPTPAEAAAIAYAIADAMLEARKR